MNASSYQCADCRGEFKHYTHPLDRVKCPFCGSEKVKIVSKTVVSPSGKVETETEVDIVPSYSVVSGIVIVMVIAIVLIVGIFAIGSLTSSLVSQLTTMTQVQPSSPVVLLSPQLPPIWFPIAVVLVMGFASIVILKKR